MTGAALPASPELSAAPGDGGRDGVRGRNAVLVLFALATALHAWLLPLFEGADEPDNLTYVRFLVEEGRLTEPATEPTRELEALGRGHMPPLWFLSLAPLFRAVGADGWLAIPALEPSFWRREPPRDAADLRARLDAPLSRLHWRHGRDERSALDEVGLGVRLLRLATLPWALVALWATWHLARRALGDGARATWATALAASLPELQHLSGTVTMDLMLAAWGALALFALAEWCAGDGAGERAGTGWALLAGAASGMAALTKLNGLVLAPACGIAALLARGRGRGAARGALACAAGLVAVAGPYYAWGWWESGHPLWMWRYQQVSPFHNPPGQAPTTWGLDGTAVFAAELFTTWLAKLGWTSVWFPQWVSAPVFALWATGAAGALALAAGGARGGRRAAALALAGLALAFAAWLLAQWSALGPARLAVPRGAAQLALALGLLALAAGAVALLRTRAVGGAPEPRGAAVRLVVLGSALMLAAEVGFNLRFPQPQARHTYPFLAALVVAAAAGLDRLRLLRATVLVQVALSVAALPLLVGRLRPEGWNASPVFAVTDARRALDPALTDEDDAEVAWVAPPVMAGSVARGPADPPELVWRIDAASEYDVAVSWNPELRRRPWRAGGELVRAVESLGRAPRGSLAIPAELWASLAPGTRLWVQVVRLGPDGSATGRSAVRELVRAE